MAITFYFAPMTSASPVAFALAELGIEYETITFDLKGDAHKQPDYLKLNPMGRVPTLVDDGQPMFESSACLIHLGDKYGVDRGLWPAPGSPERMQALTWVAWSAVTLGAAIRQLFINGEMMPEEMRNAKQAEAAHAQLAQLFGILDARLADREYMVGDGFSLVDCYVGAAAGWAAGQFSVDMTKAPNVAAWIDRCLARDSAKAVG